MQADSWYGYVWYVTVSLLVHSAVQQVPRWVSRLQSLDSIKAGGFDQSQLTWLSTEVICMVKNVWWLSSIIQKGTFFFAISLVLNFNVFNDWGMLQYSTLEVLHAVLWTLQYFVSVWTLDMLLSSSWKSNWLTKILATYRRRLYVCICVSWSLNYHFRYVWLAILKTVYTFCIPRCFMAARGGGQVKDLVLLCALNKHICLYIL